MSNKYNLEDTIFIKNKNEEILKNNELKLYVQFKLNKTNFEKKDLDALEDIMINGRKINGDINKVYFDEIRLFSNLKKIEIENLSVQKHNIKNLENLEGICFKNCALEGIEQLINTKKISINNCVVANIKELEKLKQLEELELINMYIEDFNFLKELKNLKVLKIKNLKNFSLEKINYVLPITKLSIEGIDYLNEEFILKNYPNLKILSIDLKKEKEWKENLDKLIEEEIKILINEIYEY